MILYMMVHFDMMRWFLIDQLWGYVVVLRFVVFLEIVGVVGVSCPPWCQLREGVVLGPKSGRLPYDDTLFEARCGAT